ncbi:MAG: SGNH/GDSL hydrolase family protein [Clostridia bacterium]|nr:SGNH/GDSL hydrolase family protein [Clostridia bacterium]
MTVADEDENKEADIIVFDFKSITFNGQCFKDVMPGEFFSTDPIILSFDKDEYLCLELTFSGKMIPCHEQSLVPAFIKEDSGWTYSRHMPFPGMIGCDRNIKGRIAYLGDSITQGSGTPLNLYLHWNARLSEKLGDEYAYWNIGLGFGRANDAASDGAWLYKAKQNDVVFVCFGVNDILQGLSEEQIKSDLTGIVDYLKKEGIKVVLQTVPPFDYTGENIEKWKRINEYIKVILKDKVDAVFDNVPCLGVDSSHVAKFGGHPNADGCAL